MRAEEHMIIVGERINATRKQIRAALERKDEAFFLKEAEQQLAAGSDFLDLNAGTGTGRETEDLSWLVNLVQSKFPNAKIALDSSDTAVLRNCLPLVKNTPVLVNSVNGETRKLEGFLPLLKEFPDIHLVALTMDDSGIPRGWEKRVEIADMLVQRLTQAGVKEDHIYFDALVQPVGTDSEAFMIYLKALRTIKEQHPATRSICGLSNVSFGLPKRKAVNKYALILSMYEGLEGVIIDPLDEGIAEVRCLLGALTGKDQFCLNYISYFREGKL
jgi:cobalamin-dependent methionine synthase I